MAMRKGADLAGGAAIVAQAFWLDLRGYGGMLNDAAFDPARAEAKPALRRLRRFQEVLADHSRATFPTLAINDGAVAYRDIGLTRQDRALSFIERSWDLFQAATKADLDLGGVGLRGVLACGLRARGSDRGMLAENAAVTKIVEDLADGRVSKEQALKAVWQVRRVHDIVPQLQANFAFTLAYTAEQGAGEGKLEGSRFYLDARILKSGVPDWMTGNGEYHWKPAAKWLSTLSNTFIEVGAMDHAAPDREQAIRTGREILSSMGRG